MPKKRNIKSFKPTAGSSSSIAGKRIPIAAFFPATPLPPDASHPPRPKTVLSACFPLRHPLQPPTSSLVAARVSQTVLSRQAPTERQRAASKLASYLDWTIRGHPARSPCHRPERSSCHQGDSPDPRNPCAPFPTPCSPKVRWKWQETSRRTSSPPELGLP